jgi:hypothetical protein
MCIQKPHKTEADNHEDRQKLVNKWKVVMKNPQMSLFLQDSMFFLLS